MPVDFKCAYMADFTFLKQNFDDKLCHYFVAILSLIGPFLLANTFKIPALLLSS